MAQCDEHRPSHEEAFSTKLESELALSNLSHDRLHF